jgi:hypothetical protein
MTNDRFEADLREALSRHADLVPADAVVRLGRTHYRPRTRSRVATAGMVVSALVAGVAACGITFGALHHAPGSPANRSQRPTGPTVQLAGYTIALPAGSHILAAATPPGACAPSPPPTPGVPETVQEAGGQFVAVDGGCLVIDLGPTDVPSGANAVGVGTYNGYIVDDGPDTITLYVEVFTEHDLIFQATGTGMSESQLIAMAVASIPPCSSEREDQAPCNVGQ